MPGEPLELVLNRLDKVKKHEHGWTALCPAHPDRNPSLSISVGTDDRVLLNCHAGCTVDAICRAIQLEPKDLFVPTNGKVDKQIVATYPYTDEAGTPLFEVVRFTPKDFRQRRPDGTWGLGQTRRVLFRLPRLVSAIVNGDPIYIVEGEKDALAVEAAGAVATCPPMGAGKWRDEYTLALEGARQIIIVADKDAPGLEHARQIEQSLQGHVDSITVVEAARGKDAADHLAAGLTLGELVPRLKPALGAITVVTLTDFVSVTEDTAEPLIGDRNDSLLPANGTLLMYGDGGAGKTTLSIDALAHLASGTDWLNNTVQRALRVLLIENEGPRGPFRELLGRKIGRWNGDSFTANVHVLEEPWSRFTLKEPDYRRALADQIDRTETDLIIVGPLASLGAKGTGTPDDINEFGEMTDDLRALTQRQFALWIVHHENKQGDVSGAWERVPDTLVHVSAQGNGRTRVNWRKVRWSSRLHNTSINLLWDDGGFTIDEARIRDLHLELVEAFENDDRWRTAREAAGLIGANQDKVRDALINLVENNRMRFEIGPAGRKPNAKCWRLASDSDSPSHHESQDLFGGGPEATDSPTPPTRGVGEVSQQHPHPPTDSDPPSQITPDDDPEAIYLLEKYVTPKDDPPADLYQGYPETQPDHDQPL